MFTCGPERTYKNKNTQDDIPRQQAKTTVFGVKGTRRALHNCSLFQQWQRCPNSLSTAFIVPPAGSISFCVSRSIAGTNTVQHSPQPQLLSAWFAKPFYSLDNASVLCPENHCFVSLTYGGGYRAIGDSPESQQCRPRR